MNNLPKILSMLENNINFSIARFNDGEILAMCGENGQFTARGDQQINDSLRENLVRAVKHEQENYWKCFPCSTCFKKHREIADSYIRKDYEYKCLATIFGNSNWRNFIRKFPEAIKDRGDVIFVSGDDQNPSHLWFMPIITKVHVTIPNKNSWQYYQDVRDNTGLIKEFTRNTIVLLSCGPLSRVLVCDWFQKYPDCTFIDIGSCFDPFTRNVWHNYHLGNTKFCPECNNV